MCLVSRAKAIACVRVGEKKIVQQLTAVCDKKKDENKKIGINMADEVAEDSLKSAVRPERNKSIARYSHKLTLLRLWDDGCQR